MRRQMLTDWLPRADQERACDSCPQPNQLPHENAGVRYSSEVDAPGMAACGALLPYRSERERKQRVGYDAFAKPSANDRNLRIAVVHNAASRPDNPARRRQRERAMGF